MIEEMLEAMARDLHVCQFVGESEAQFINRLLYSAMACWIKTSALDRSISFANDFEQGVSRRHILERCNKILKEILARLSETSQKWFETETGTENAIQLLRSRLIRHGDLLNIGFRTDLTLASESVVSLDDDLECGKGYLIDNSFVYSGIAMLRKRQAESHFDENERTDSCEWLRDYVRTAWWKKADELTGIEYFNPLCKANALYRCWQDYPPVPVEGVILARCKAKFSPDEYLLIRLGENIKIHRIDSFLREIGECRRFQFALRKIADNPLVVYVKIYQDHIHLKLNSFLPEWEKKLLESFAWPYCSISDKLEWDITPFVWLYIRKNFEKLGVCVREENVDG